MKIRKAVYLFYNTLSPSLSDDTAMPSAEMVYDFLVQARATYIRQEMSNKRMLPEVLLQSIDCLPLEEVSQAQCGLKAPEGCIWLKTKKIPHFIKLDKITNSDATVNYDIIGFDRAKGISKRRIASSRKGKYATIKDEEIYILNSKYIDSINLYGVVEDPLEVVKCVNPKEALCNPMEQDFHTSIQYLDIIIKLAIENYIRTLPAQEKVQINNDTSESRESTQQTNS